MLGTGSKRTDIINPQPKTKIKIKQIAPLKITNYVIVSPKPKNEAYEQAGGLDAGSGAICRFRPYKNVGI